MTEAAFYSRDPTGRRRDADLHAELLNNPQMDDLIARQAIALAVAKGGMLLAEAVALYGTESIRKIFETEGTDPRLPELGASSPPSAS